jgi:hypothetical protein
MVGCPVEGPDRWTLTITQGVSVINAYPIFSIMSENPGPEVVVMALAPAQEAPITDDMAASSSSIWMYAPPTLGINWDMISAVSVAGVIGYPPKKVHPANNAP